MILLKVCLPVSVAAHLAGCFGILKFHPSHMLITLSFVDLKLEKCAERCEECSRKHDFIELA